MFWNFLLILERYVMLNYNHNEIDIHILYVCVLLDFRLTLGHYKMMFSDQNLSVSLICINFCFSFQKPLY